jgi:hypothetical protein
MEKRDLKYWQVLLYDDFSFYRIYDINLDINNILNSITPLTFLIFEIGDDIIINKKINNIIDYLLDQGCDIQGENDMAFCMAIIMGNCVIAERLLKMGADINAIPNQTFMDYVIQNYTRCNISKMKYDFFYHEIINDLACDVFDEINENDTTSLKGFLLYTAIRVYVFRPHTLNLLIDYNINTVGAHRHTLISDLLFIDKTPHDLIKKLIIKAINDSKLHKIDILLIYDTYIVQKTNPTFYEEIKGILEPYINEEMENNFINISIEYYLRNDNMSWGDSYINRMIHCINNFDIGKYLTQEKIDIICDNMIVKYHDMNWELLKYIISLGFVIDKYISTFMIQAMYHKDNVMLCFIVNHMKHNQIWYHLNEYMNKHFKDLVDSNIYVESNDTA